MRAVLLSTVSVACALGLASAANAATVVLFNDTDVGSNGYDNVADNGFLADSFSTGGSSFFLTKITVIIDGASTDGGSFEINLLSDNSDKPGSQIATTGAISDSILNSALTAQTFALSAALSPDTRYWIQIESTSGPSSVNWSYTLDPSDTGESGQFFSSEHGMVFPDVAGPYQMAIQTPEAPVWAVLLAGFGGLGAVLRRRIRSQLA